MSFSEAGAARELLTSQPGCQVIQPHMLAAKCEPGCVHEQLQVASANVYALLSIDAHLDGIEAALTTIARHQ